MGWEIKPVTDVYSFRMIRYPLFINTIDPAIGDIYLIGDSG